MRSWVQEAMRRREKSRGQGLTEYIIIVAFIALVCIGVIAAFGKQIREYFWQTGNALAEKDGNVTVENKMGDQPSD